MDYRLQTFIILCETMNYRITAQRLHLTQPAVTKQIQALERDYKVKLFSYDGKRLEVTDEGRILEKYASSLRRNYEELERALAKQKIRRIRVGATKTIGEYVIGHRISEYLRGGEHSVVLEVDNTHNLMQMLDRNEIDFAVVEGFFSKTDYAYKLYRREKFIGICSKESELCGRTVKLEELFRYSIIVRENGSGTRDILENELHSAGYSLGAFSSVSEISSFRIISALVADGLGISFVYESVYEGEQNLGSFCVDGFAQEHEFNIVYLENTNAGTAASEFFNIESYST